MLPEEIRKQLGDDAVLVRVRGEIDKNADFIVLDSGNYGYRDNKLILESIGRMSYESYGKKVYPFFPAFLSFHRAIYADFSDITKFENESIINEVSCTQEEVRDALISEVKKRVESLLDPVTLSRRLGESLRFKTGSLDVQQDIIDTTLDMSAFDSKALLEELGTWTDIVIKKYAKSSRVTKKVRTNKKIPVAHQSAVFYFANNLVIAFEDASAALMKILYPTIVRHRERIEQVKRWRTEGLKDEEWDYEDKGTKGTGAFDHQKVMYKIHTLLDNSMNLGEMGTGKTKAVLMSIDKRLQRGEVRKGYVLVVGINTTAENWMQEIKDHTPHLKGAIINGSYGDRFSMLMQRDEADIDIYFINYEAFIMSAEMQTANGQRKDVPISKLFKVFGWDMVVLDECHKIKNPDAKRTGAIIDALSSAQYKIGMSGTIGANKLYDLHTPFVWLNGGFNFNSVLTERGSGKKLTLGELSSQFKDAYFSRDGYKYVPNPGTVEELRDRMEEVSVRYEKSECFTLPPKMYEIRNIDMSPKQAKLYQALEARLIADLSDIAQKGGVINPMNILAMMTKLAEAANGWIYDDDHNLIELPWNPKLDAVIEACEEVGEENKVVIWSRFIHDLHLISDKLKELYGPESVAVMHGGETCSVCGSRKDERFEITQRFNDKNNPLRFVVANPATGGHGINLFATYAFFYSNSFVKTDRGQAEDRHHRIGMRDHLTIVDFVMKTTIDETVLVALKSWKGMMGALLTYLGIDLHVKETQEAPAIVELQKIVHQQQGYNECMLAAIAMLSGKALSEVKHWALTTFHSSNWSYCNTRENAMAVVRQYVPWLETGFEHYFHEAGEGNLRLSQQLQSIPIVGRGFAIVRYTNSGRNHIVVYENGHVFDPGETGPLSLVTYNAKAAERGAVVQWVFNDDGGRVKGEVQNDATNGK